MALDGVIATGNKYLQVFDLAAAPTGGEVPLKSVYCQTAGVLPSLFYNTGPIVLYEGLFVAISSTDTTYTPDATSFDIFGEIEEYEVPISTAIGKRGDLTTGRDQLTLWTTAQIAAIMGRWPRTFEVRVINGLGVNAWLLFFLVQTPGNGSTPVPNSRLPILNNTLTQKYIFGREGLLLMPVIGGVAFNATAGLSDFSCAVSTTPDVCTLDGGNLNKIQAYVG
jgi:hypothetical protein